MPIMRLATSRAMSFGVIALPLVAGAVTLNSGPNASVNFENDSISRYDVGNQIGPRQFELPPLILTSASPGSDRTGPEPKLKGCSLWNFDRLRMPPGERNSDSSQMRVSSFSS